MTERSNRGMRARPGHEYLRRYWFALRAKADAGDPLALALVIALAEGRPIAGAPLPAEPAAEHGEMLLG